MEGCREEGECSTSEESVYLSACCPLSSQQTTVIENPKLNSEQTDRPPRKEEFMLNIDHIGDYPQADYFGGDRNIKTNLSRLVAYLANPVLFLTGKIHQIEPQIKKGAELEILLSKCPQCQRRFRWNQLVGLDKNKPRCPVKTCNRKELKKPGFFFKLTIIHGCGFSEALLIKKNADYFFGHTVSEFLEDSKVRKRMREATEWLTGEGRILTLCVRQIDFKQPYRYIIQNTQISLK